MERDYPRLNFTVNASVYFYGCHIARNKKADGTDENWPNGDDYLQEFSNYQQVKVYANRYGTSFSADPDVKVLISDPSTEDVYLGSYALDDFVMPHEDYMERGLGALGIENSYVILYFDKFCQGEEMIAQVFGDKVRRIPFVVYTPDEPVE